MEQLKNIGLLALALLALFLGIKACNKPIEHRSILRHVDTVVQVKTEIDTAWKTRTVTKTVYLDKELPGDSIKAYNFMYEDDTVSVHVNARAVKLVQADINTKINLPTITVRKDSTITIKEQTTIYDTVYKKTLGYALSGGIHTMVDGTRYDLGPSVSLSTPVGNIGYNYGVFQKSHQVYVQIPIIKPKR